MGITNHTKLAKRLPRWLYRFCAQRYIDMNFPRHIYIETTTRCNKTCWHCPRPTISKDMTRETFEKIIDECAEHGARSFSLHIFGEPLMDKYLLQKIDYIKEKNKRNNIILTTNGTIINNKVFDRVDKIITTNQDFPDKWKRKTHIRVFGENEVYHNFGGHIKVDRTNVPRYPCYHLWLSPAIAWNGDFLICCNDPKHETKLGNVNENSIKFLWTHPLMYKLRRMHYCEKYPGLCGKCNVWKKYKNMFTQS